MVLAWEETPTDKLPVRDVNQFLAAYGPAFKALDHAGRCETCDWQLRRHVSAETLGTVLSEVQQSCSRLLIISRGKLVADGPVERLIAQAEGVAQITVEASGPGVAATLSHMPGAAGMETLRAGADGRVAVRLTAARGAAIRPAIFELAKQHGWTLYELHQESSSLEELFRQLTAAPPRPTEGA